MTKLKNNFMLQIVVGLTAGLLLVALAPKLAADFGILGSVFVRSLRSVAPVLIFMLVLSSIANKEIGHNGRLKDVIVLYLLGTFAAAVIAVTLSLMFPSDLDLKVPENIDKAPKGVGAVLTTLVLNVVDNPFNALLSGNFIGVLAWAVGLGVALRHAAPQTKTLINDLSSAMAQVVQWVIKCAPIGVFGLVAETFSAENGFSAMASYLHLLTVLLAAIVITALILNPALVYWKIRRNPYPLVMTCIRESGSMAFFTRSSAANIPVNIDLAKRLGLKEEIYSVAIPLGATINMAGAAITITVLTLAAAKTIGIDVDFGSAVLLSFVASICACGASGVAGGSLLLIPLACSLFKIPNDVAAQVIGVGFIISAVQDSAETALNSSTDVIFTAAVSINQEKTS